MPNQLSLLTRGLAVLAVSLTLWSATANAFTKNNIVTRNYDNSRSNYYPKSGLSKQDILNDNYGLAFVTKLNGDAINNNVTAQPLIYTPKSYGKPIVLIGTEYNTIYIIDAISGTIINSQNFGPVGPTNVWGFDSVVPGILATPVIDTDTDTVFFVTCKYLGDNKVKYWFYAADVMTLAVKPNFPVSFSDVKAANDPFVKFDDFYQKSRAALMMTGGMVVVCFAGYDFPPYQGWVHVIDPVTAAFKTAFTTVSNQDMAQGGGGGIWMAGYGPSTLDDGNFYIATGNANFNESTTPLNESWTVANVLMGPTVGNDLTKIPRTLFESVVHMKIDGSSGAVSPFDWYTPYNATMMDFNDTDTAADAVVILPDAFGNQQYPKVLLAGAKQGPLKILNLNNLGGYQQGANGMDAIITEIDPYTYSPQGLGVWGSAGAYPLEGAYLYFSLAQGNIQAWKKSSTADGSIAFEFVGASEENFRGGVSTPIVAGSGKVGDTVVVTLDAEPLPESDMWEFLDMERITIWDTIPNNGTLAKLWSFNVTSRHFGAPGIGENGMVYVASLDGHLYGFGPASSFYAPSNWTYQGCYDDTNTTGLFEVRIGSGSVNYSIDSCIAEATSRNLSMAGLRNGGECYVGNSWGNKTVITSRVSQCTMTCGGNSTQVCGGGNSVSVFAVGEKKGGVPVGPITTTSSVPNSGSISSSGLSVGAIVGIVAAVLVAVAVVVVIAIVLVGRRGKGRVMLSKQQDAS